MDRLRAPYVQRSAAMNSAPRRKLPTPPAGVASFLPARPCDARSVRAATGGSTRLPTVLALHAAMALSGVAFGCAGAGDGGDDAIHADRHTRVAATPSSTTTAPSAAT